MRKEFSEAIEALEAERVKIALGGVVNPQREPFSHGLQVGHAQGLMMAQEILRQLDQDDD